MNNCTEEQAKEKRCCGTKGCGEQRGHFRYCIASDCMAWQWYIGPIGGGEELDFQRSLGHCGLTGRGA